MLIIFVKFANSLILILTILKNKILKLIDRYYLIRNYIYKGKEIYNKVYKRGDE